MLPSLLIPSSRRVRRRTAPVGGAVDLFTTTFETAQASGTYSFMMGVPVAEGVAFSITANGPASYQFVTIATWPDGSIKMGALCGLLAVTQNVPKSVTVRAGGTAPTGAALTQSDIPVAARGTYSAAASGIGTASFTVASDTPHRTWVPGHAMSEFHFYGGISGNLESFLYLRVFENDDVVVCAELSNGRLNNGGSAATNTDLTYTPTITLNGTAVYNNGGSNLRHYAATAFYNPAEWTYVHGTDPAWEVVWDTQYLIDTLLVSNYTYGPPSATVLNGLADAYAPTQQADLPTIMSQGGGDNPYIGLLPLWDVAVLTSDCDQRALKACLVNSSAIRSYPIVWRDATTHKIPRPSDFPTWTCQGWAGPFTSANSGGPGGNGIKELYNRDGSGGYDQSFEYHHSPLQGYLAFLLTADFRHLETLMMLASVRFLWLSSSNGSGTSRNLIHGEVRGWAWAQRDLAALCAVGPNGDTIVEDYRDWLAHTYNHFCSFGPHDPAASQLGYPCLISTYDAGDRLRFAPFMPNYWGSVNGWASNVKPLGSDDGDLIDLRDFMYQAVVGFLGITSDEWCFNDGGVGGDDTDSPILSDDIVAGGEFTRASQYYEDWGKVWLETKGSANTACTVGSALIGTSGGNPAIAATGRWGTLLPFLSYAVDHGAPGAAAAYARLTGASNWSVFDNSGFEDFPTLGIKPR